MLFVSGSGDFMMRIETEQIPGSLTLRVAGKLCGACVAALEDCWRSERRNSPAAGQTVDLSNVTSIDKGGWDLLRRMHHDGVKLLAKGLARQTIVDQLTDQTEERCS